MPYNDKLNADDQITVEEAIAAVISDAQERSMDDNGDPRQLTEQNCGDLGRQILAMVLEEFRPDLMDGEDDDEALPGEDPEAALASDAYTCRTCQATLHFPDTEYTRQEVLQSLAIHTEGCTGFKGLPADDSILDNYTWEGQ